MDDRTLAILKRRAERYAKPLEEQKQQTSIGMYLGARIRDVYFGLPTELVLECAALTHWTPFPGRRHLLGITHLRGDVMALMDLLGAVTDVPSPACNNMAVLHGAGGRFAVALEEVAGIRDVEMDELLPPEQSPIHSPFITAATRDLWFLLDEQHLKSLAVTASANPAGE